MTMKTKGSKSAPNKRLAKTPARGGEPEVTLENGTTVVLQNPAGAPPPSKRPGRGPKPVPTVATKPAKGAPGTEVPDWAKRAAARDTAKEMAAVSDGAVTPEPTPAALVAVPKTGRPPTAAKAKDPAREPPIAKPGSLRAIGNAWIESLRAAGHSKSTVSSYSADLEVAYEVLDGDSAATDLTEKQIIAFNESKAVLRKKNGKAKAKPTILKTRRALRLALVWAVQTGRIKKAPFPTKTSA
jgi:hypothetical protein